MSDTASMDFFNDSDCSPKDLFQLQLVGDPGMDDVKFNINEVIGHDDAVASTSSENIHNTSNHHLIPCKNELEEATSTTTPTVVCTKYEIIQQTIGPSTSYYITPYTVKRPAYGFLETNDLDMANDPAYNEFWSCPVDCKFYICLSDYGMLPSMKTMDNGINIGLGLSAATGGTMTMNDVKPPLPVPLNPKRFIVKEKIGQLQNLSHLTLAEIQQKLLFHHTNQTRKVWVICKNVVLSSPDIENFFHTPEVTGSITHFSYGWSQVTDSAQTKILPDTFARLLARFPSLEYLAFNFNFNMDVNDTGLDGQLKTTVQTIMSRPTNPIRPRLVHLKTLRLNKPYQVIWSLVREIIKAAPNIQNIYGFPWAHINTLRSIAGTYNDYKRMVGRTMKSYSNPHGMTCFPLRANLDNISVIQTIAYLPDLHLEELHIFFHFMPNQFKPSDTHSQLKNVFSRLLKMSAETLKMMTLQPMEFVGFLEFAPCMEGMRTIKFIQESPVPEIRVNGKGQRPKRSKKKKCLFIRNFSEPEPEEEDEEEQGQIQTEFNKYFPRGFDISKVFPRLLNVSIKMKIDEPDQSLLDPLDFSRGSCASSSSSSSSSSSLGKRKFVPKNNSPPPKTPMEIFEDFFPSDTFDPNRPLTTVRHLRLEEHLPMDCLERLLLLFPSLTAFSLTCNCATDVSLMLPRIFALWPQLEVICLKIDMNHGDFVPQNGFDSIFTGIPEDRCETIRESAGVTGQNNNMLISRGMVEQYRTEPAITGMKNLRLFKLELKNIFVRNSDDDPSLFSCVAALYAFGLMPTLEFYLKFDPECTIARKNAILYLLRNVRSFITVDG